METIPIIRRNTYKAYLGNGFFGGLIIGLLFFGLFLLNTDLKTAIYTGLFFWISISIIWMSFGFLGQEYFKRKREIKRLQSGNYQFLHDNGFNIHEDLYFEGIYKDFYVKVFPMTQYVEKGKDIRYYIIETFYDINKAVKPDYEEMLSGKYYWGIFSFSNGCAGLLPKDYNNPNFNDDIDALINLCKRENLIPLSYDDWDDRFGKKLRQLREDEMKNKLVNIIKIGKFEINRIKKTTANRVNCPTSVS